jgi:hypothetical protein
MQFAGGMSIACVAALWETDAEFVESAIRQSMLGLIPRRDGGTKVPRSEARAARSCEVLEAGPEQVAFDFGGMFPVGRADAPERIAA